MSYSYESGGDLSTGGKFLRDEGTYHFFIVAVDERPTKRNGDLINNAAFRVSLEVLKGTAEGQKGKLADILFFNPTISATSDGSFAKKKLDLFFLATAMRSESELSEKGRKQEIELADLVGRQFVAKFHIEKDDNGKDQIGLCFADMWHVDDSAVANIPKDADALAMIDPKLRRIGAKAAPTKEPTKKESTPAKKQEADKQFADI